MTQADYQHDDSDEIHPADLLVNAIAALLAPMFLGRGCWDVDLAEGAALETVACYCGQNLADLLIIAQLVGFHFATLGALSHAARDDLPAPMLLKMYNAANALRRSGERMQKAHGMIARDVARQIKQQSRTPQPPPAAPGPEPAPPQAGPAAKLPEPATPLASLLPASPPVLSVRAQAISTVAHDILTAEPPYAPNGPGQVRPDPISAGQRPGLSP